VVNQEVVNLEVFDMKVVDLYVVGMEGVYLKAINLEENIGDMIDLMIVTLTLVKYKEADQDWDNPIAEAVISC